MQSWNRPEIPAVPGQSAPPMLFDTPSGNLLEARPDHVARLYVCGITPYDATHVGHAATYLAFDTLHRVWLDGGYRVEYTQNVTDIDDPLLDRAREISVGWRNLADEQIEVFRHDMDALDIIPPDDFVAVTEVIDQIAEAVCVLLDRQIAYRVPADDAEGDDIYFDNAYANNDGANKDSAGARPPWHLGAVSNLDEATMRTLFSERGGDPDRAGKRSSLDPLLWRSARAGEPSWPSRVGQGRPGWHIECSVIALKHLGTDFTVQGGATDLIFPHHEFSAGHAAALSGRPLARLYSHAGLVSYQGQKMSKSLGNLVFVSRLLDEGVDPRALRLAILSQHYRSEWEWSDALLATAAERLAVWSATLGSARAGSGWPAHRASDVVEDLRSALHDDLNTPRAIRIVDHAVAEGIDDPRPVARAVHALLGITL